MQRNSKRVNTRLKVALTSFMALMLVLTACGQSNQASSPSATADGTEPTDGAATDTSGSDLDELVAAAQQEGKVVVYGSPGESGVQEWIKGFEDEYGVTVEYFRAPSNELQQRWEQETQAGQHIADVIAHSLPLKLRDAADRGWIDDYVPMTADKYPDKYIIGGILPLYVSLDAIAWNTDQVSDEEAEMLREEKLDAFRESRWQGRLALVSMGAGGPQLANYQQLIEEREEEYGWSFLEDVAENNPTIHDSGVAMTGQIVAGEYAASFTVPDTIAAAQVLDGAPIEWVYRDNPSAASFMIAASANAPNPNAARLFMEWATGLEGQNAFMNIKQGVSLHEDWVDQRPITEQPWFVPYEGEPYLEWIFDEELASRADDLLAKYNETFGVAG